MKEIPLTQGRVALVDDEDFDFINQWKWYVAHGHAVHHSFGRHTRFIHMHRIIAERHGINLNGQLIDHRDGDGLSEFIKCLGNVIGVPKNNTTKLCHICGSKLKIDGRVATCQNCGAMDRDYNAAKNILQRGLEMLKLSNFSTKIKLNSLQGKELVSSVV